MTLSITGIKRYLQVLNIYKKTEPPKPTEEKSEVSGSNDEKTNMIAQFRKQIENDKFSNIRQQLLMGKSLSSAELEYLREKDPDMYLKAKQQEMEKIAYQRALRSCKTKDEAVNLHTQRIISAKPLPGESSERAQMNLEVSKNTINEFTRTHHYKKMPWQHEVNSKKKKPYINTSI